MSAGRLARLGATTDFHHGLLAGRIARAVAGALVVAAGTMASAQTPGPGALPSAQYLGKTIVDVRLSIEDKPANDTALAQLIETRTGQPFSMAAIRDSVSHLFNLGRFEDVQVEAADAPGGVRLLYTLVPLHAVARVEFRGSLGVPEGDLRKAVSDRFGPLPTVGRAAEVVRALEQQFYPDRGYLRASAEPKTTQLHDPDLTILTFEVTAGPRARIRRSTVEGDPLEPLELFKERLGVVEGAAYDQAATRSAIDDYVRRMRRARRYQASASYSGRPSADGTAVDVDVTVDPGPVVSVVVEGDPLTRAKIAELVPLEREGSADQDLIEDAARRIADHLHEQGHWKATVLPERRESPGALAIVFTVKKGPAYRIAEDGLDVSGNQSGAELPAPPTSLVPGKPFVQGVLEAYAGAIKARYLTLGYASVKVVADPLEVAPSLVRPVIVITEGPRTVTGAITFENNKALTADQLLQISKLAPGAAFFAPTITEARDSIVVAYLNEGYASAQVTVNPARSADGTRIDLTFKIDEGPQTIVDHIMIVGNVRTKQRIIERELLVEPGKPMSLDKLLESRARLTSLGLFRRVQVTPVPHENGTTGDVLVSVQEAAATTLDYGGGGEVSELLRATGPDGTAESVLNLAPRGFVDIGRRNIGGKNRSVNLFTRLSLRPSGSAPGSPDTGSQFGFSEYRVVATYREPKAIGPKVDLTLTGAREQGVRSSFNFARSGVTAELVQRVSPSIRTSARYTFGTTRTFDEALTEEDQVRIDRILPGVRLSVVAGAVSRDSRDEAIDATRGTFLSADVALASKAIGGEVGYLKTYLQASWFRRLPVKRRVVFATRAIVGLADGFPRFLQTTDDSGNLITEINEDLPASERFFAGGETTIRGYTLDTVGAPNTISSTGFPKGGNALLVLNGELRVALKGPFGAAVFVDGGNVFSRVTEFDFGELRGAVGVGLRLATPIGPIRLDVGFKMDRRTIGTSLEPRTAFHFSVGQAF